MQQFLEVFAELKGKNFYLTGESVSSTFNCQSSYFDFGISMRGCMCLVRAPFSHMRCSYADLWLDITNYIYENPGKLDLNTKGFWISDRAALLTSPE